MLIELAAGTRPIDLIPIASNVAPPYQWPAFVDPPAVTAFASSTPTSLPSEPSSSSSTIPAAAAAAAPTSVASPSIRRPGSSSGSAAAAAAAAAAALNSNMPQVAGTPVGLSRGGATNARSFLKPKQTYGIATLPLPGATPPPPPGTYSRITLTVTLNCLLASRCVAPVGRVDRNAPVAVSNEPVLTLLHLLT
jgi:hypothetical protein